MRQLEKQFHNATDLYVSAIRQAGEVGLAAIADPEAAINKVKEVRSKLTELMGTLTEKKAVAKAQELEEKIRLFSEKNEID